MQRLFKQSLSSGTACKSKENLQENDGRKSVHVIHNQKGDTFTQNICRFCVENKQSKQPHSFAQKDWGRGGVKQIQAQK